MATKTQYYNLDKPGYDEVADIEVINANMDKIDQQMRNNADGVNFAKGISSDAYDNSKLYAVGDYCIYDNKLYRCITAIESAEEFNIAKWKQTTVGKEVNQLNSNLDGLQYSDIAGGKNLLDLPNPYSVTGTYYKIITVKVKKNTNYTLSVGSVTSSVYQAIIVRPINSDTNIIAKYSAPYIMPFNSGDNESIRILFYSGNTTSGTSVYSDVQLEYGTTATPYEPYIPSVKMIAEEVSAQNESLGDYGFTNVFDGEWLQGWIGSDGTVSISTSLNGSLIKQGITCKIGDVITIVCDSSETEINIGEFDSSNEKANTVTSKTNTNRVEYKVSLSSTTYVRFSIRGKNPANVGNIKVYINNAIDELKNDLGGLSFSVSGTTLSITDGTNTWNLSN